MTKAKANSLPDGTRVYFHRPNHRDDGDKGELRQAHRRVEWDDSTYTSFTAVPMRYVRIDKETH